MDHDSFYELISELRSPDNLTRQKSEELYSQLEATNQFFVFEELFRFLSDINEGQKRNEILFMLILAKHLLTTQKEFFQISPLINQENIEGRLIDLFKFCSDDQVVQKNLSALIFEFYLIFSQRGIFKNFFDFLAEKLNNFECTNLFEANVILNIIFQSLSYGILSCDFIKCNEMVLSKYFFEQQNQLYYPIILNFMRLIFYCFSKKVQLDIYKSFPEYLIYLIFHAPKEYLNNILIELISFGQNVPEFFNSKFEELLKFVIGVIHDFNEGSRILCLELLKEIISKNSDFCFRYLNIILNNIFEEIQNITEELYLNNELYEEETFYDNLETFLSEISSIYQNNTEYIEFFENLFKSNAESNDINSLRSLFIILRNIYNIYYQFSNNYTEFLVTKIIFIFSNYHCKSLNHCILDFLSVLCKNQTPMFQNEYIYNLKPFLLNLFEEEISPNLLQLISYFCQCSSIKEHCTDFLNIFLKILNNFYNYQSNIIKLILQSIENIIIVLGEEFQEYYLTILPVIIKLIESNQEEIQIYCIKLLSVISKYEFFYQTSSNTISNIFLYLLNINHDNFNEDEVRTYYESISYLILNFDKLDKAYLNNIISKFKNTLNKPIDVSIEPYFTDYSSLYQNSVIEIRQDENSLYIYNKKQIEEICHILITIQNIILIDENQVDIIIQEIFNSLLTILSYSFSNEILIELFDLLENLIVTLFLNSNPNIFNVILNIYQRIQNILENHKYKIENIEQFNTFNTTILNIFIKLTKANIPNNYYFEYLKFYSFLIEYYLQYIRQEGLSKEEQENYYDLLTEFLKKFLKIEPKELLELISQVLNNIYLLSELDLSDKNVSQILDKFEIWSLFLIYNSFDENIYLFIFKFLDEHIFDFEDEEQIRILKIYEILFKFEFKEKISNFPILLNIFYSKLIELSQHLYEEEQFKEFNEIFILIICENYSLFEPNLQNDSTFLTIFYNKFPVFYNEKELNSLVYSILFLILIHNQAFLTQDEVKVVKLLNIFYKILQKDSRQLDDDVRTQYSNYLISLFTNENKSMLLYSISKLSHKKQSFLLDYLEENQKSS